MAIHPTIITLAVLFAAAFAPSIIYLTWIKNREKFVHRPIVALVLAIASFLTMIYFGVQRQS